MQNKAPKGTRDILPQESYKWQYVEAAMRDVCGAFGYQEIRVPVFENTEVFERSVGDTTDIVQKEMYTFPDKAGRSLTLRPEGTAGVVRSFIENGMHSLPMPIKAYYILTAYRYENVEKGRYREFRQFGAEALGAAGPACDVEVISMLAALFRRLGLANVDLRVNSIGCPACRAAYNEALRAYFAPKVGGMCEDCQDRFEKNPLRMIDCKDERCKGHAAAAPMMLDFLCEGCREHFAGVREGLGKLGIAHEVDKGIVRGLDYYTRTVFEFVSTNVGSQGTICGGGRYDGLVRLCGGPDTPAVGFALGMERLLMEMEACGAGIPADGAPLLFLIPTCHEAGQAMNALAYELRSEGRRVGFDVMRRSVKAQMKYADKLGAAYTAVVGEDELASGVVRVRDMRAGTEREVALAGLGDLVRSGGLA